MTKPARPTAAEFAAFSREAWISLPGAASRTRRSAVLKAPATGGVPAADRELVAEIEEESRVMRLAKSVEPLGADAVRRQHPHTRPNRTKKSPAPLFHTASKKAYLTLREAYSRFVAAFRDAAEKLKAGDRTVSFPEGSFPPAAPFVRPAFA